MDRRWLWPAAIAAAVIALRLATMADQLWAWDSVLYARALERGFHVDFELPDQRPQPPGYILYLAFASLFRALGAGTNGGLVLVSVLASGLGAAAIFTLARRFAGHRAALIATIAFACDPLIWLYGSVAYPYALLGALSVTLAGLFWHARQARGAWPVFASVAFGLLAGFRQDLGLLLGVLWLWMLVPAGRRERVIALAAVFGGITVWLLPTAILSDGLGAYLTALARQSDQVRSTYSVQAQGLEALWTNARFTLYALAWGLLGTALVLATVGAAAALEARRAGRPRLGLRGGFFAAWLLPGMVFYVAVHIGEWGYVLSVLPGLHVLAAVAIARLSTALGPLGRRRWHALALAGALAPALVFLFSSERFSLAAIRQHDEALRARVAYVRETFPPESTVILAREDWLLVRYYLPAYRAWLYDPEPYGHGAAKRKKTMRTTTIVIFTEGLTPRRSLAVRSVSLGPGIRISYFTVEPGEVLEFYGERYMVREPE